MTALAANESPVRPRAAQVRDGGRHHRIRSRDRGDKATFEQPHQPSVGFAYVFVNGQKVLDHGKLSAARPGRGLRGRDTCRRSGAAGSDTRAADARVATRRRLFVLATYAIPSLVAAVSKRPANPPVGGRRGVAPQVAARRGRLVDALRVAVVDSLGSGGWWLLFALVGALATIPKWLPGPEQSVPTEGCSSAPAPTWRAYEIAGAILAWRLG